MQQYKVLCSSIGLLLCGNIFAQKTQDLPVPTVEDAVRMVRIQYNVALDGSVAAISPDGKKAAAVTWRGDIARNVNVYTLTVFDIDSSTNRTPSEILSKDFAGDPDDQIASPFSKVVFLADNRTLAYLGRDGDETQVYTVDTVSKKVNQLTHHPSPVRSFVVDPDGSLRAFAAVAVPEKNERKSRLEGDGVFLWDSKLFPLQFGSFSPMPLLWQTEGHQIRQYFLNTADGPKLFFDSRQSKPAEAVDLSDRKVATSGGTESWEDEAMLRGSSTLAENPKDKSLVMFPYALTNHPMHPERYAYYNQPLNKNAFIRRLAAPYGLVNPNTGKVEVLIDAPHPVSERYEGGDALWGPAGKSVLIYTLLPDAPADPPKWVEVDIATRKATPLGLPKDWHPIAWAADGKSLILSGKDGKFGNVPRTSTGWGKFVETGAAKGFNKDWSVATNGQKLIGVRDASLTPPELATYELNSGKVEDLSNFNPQLHERKYGSVELWHWPSTSQKDAAGFLIKPVGYKPGTRYPLVVLLDDNTMGRVGEPYLLDASWQLSGHAIQMLAAQGYVVLYPREPILRDVVETDAEGKRVREYLESAVAELDKEGLIDPKRVGLSGWSRAGYYTDYMLIHSSINFAAASAIDGGGVEYNDGMRAFSDDELKHIRTPKLLEAHGLTSLVWLAGMADRMTSLGKPNDILYFATASHSTTRPQHRLRSLGTHLDWWNFWLKGQEDPDPIKADQYTHWRKLRETQKSAGKLPG